MPKISNWYKHAVFYEINVRSFYDSSGDGIGDIQGVIQKLDYLEYLGVNCIWLLPINPSPLRDGGYDITNYTDIHADYGNLDDFKALTKAAHSRGMRIITDLVLNHTSVAHPWFQEARSDKNSPYRNYYVWSDDDKKYKDTRIIFTDTEESNWSWDDEAGQYYWHRFFSHQPDLNYDNEAVHQEMLGIMKFWLDLGIDGFRLDAIPYLYEREGTTSENLIETIDFLKRTRQFVDSINPEAVLLAEANQWPEDTIPYFGEGDVLQMAFHFPLMPRIYLALSQESREPILDILARTQEIPENTQWCLFLRNHDELTLEMVSGEERNLLWEHYAPSKDMRLNLGIRRRLAPLLDHEIERILLANSLILTMPGSPGIYYGDEIGMADDTLRPDRDGVRTPMQWDNTESAGFSAQRPEMLFAMPLRQDNSQPIHANVKQQREDQGSLLERMRHLLKIREQYALFSTGNLSWENHNLPTSILAFKRYEADQELLILHNLSAREQVVEFDFPNRDAPTNVITNRIFGSLENNRLRAKLNPHEFVWLDINI
jgi:maltose alpha-D-glucosyltransferase/alpha-amylase